jgi:hypothetical protein
VTNAADLDELHHAIKRGDLLALRTYLERGGSIVATDRYGWTPLLMAAKQGHTPMVRTLLEAGADPNGGFESGFTPVVAAAISGSRESVEALLAAGADPSVAYGQPLIEIMRKQAGPALAQPDGPGVWHVETTDHRNTIASEVRYGQRPAGTTVGAGPLPLVAGRAYRVSLMVSEPLSDGTTGISGIGDLTFTP